MYLEGLLYFLRVAVRRLESLFIVSRGCLFGSQEVFERRMKEIVKTQTCLALIFFICQVRTG